MMKHFLDVFSYIGGVYFSFTFLIFIIYKFIKKDIRFFKLSYFKFIEEPFKTFKKDVS